MLERVHKVFWRTELKASRAGENGRAPAQNSFQVMLKTSWRVSYCHKCGVCICVQFAVVECAVTTRMVAMRIGFSRTAGFSRGPEKAGYHANAFCSLFLWFQIAIWLEHISGPEFEILCPELLFAP